MAVLQQLRGLSETDKPRLARLGLRFGVESIYLPDLLKPAPIELRALLWNLYHGTEGVFHAPPPAGRVAIDAVEKNRALTCVKRSTYLIAKIYVTRCVYDI